MDITQRRITTTTTFRFDAETLTHSRTDLQGAHSTELPYGSIGMDPHTNVERNDILFCGGLLLLLWGLSQALHGLLHDDVLALVFLFPGLAGLILYRLTSITVTYLDSDDGEIAVLHDGQQDRVIEEIARRRKNQLLDWYGTINFANDPDDEIRKFHWLHSQQLISDDRLERIIEAIRTAEASRQDDFEEPGLPQQ